MINSFVLVIPFSIFIAALGGIIDYYWYGKKYVAIFTKRELIDIYFFRSLVEIGCILTGFMLGAFWMVMLK